MATRVIITGNWISSDSQVSFDGSAASSVVVLSRSETIAISPPHSTGTAHIAVSNAAGTSATSSDEFNYDSPPSGGVALREYKRTVWHARSCAKGATAGGKCSVRHLPLEHWSGCTDKPDRNTTTTRRRLSEVPAPATRGSPAPTGSPVTGVSPAAEVHDNGPLLGAQAESLKARKCGPDRRGHCGKQHRGPFVLQLLFDADAEYGHPRVRDGSHEGTDRSRPPKGQCRRWTRK